MKKVNLKEKTRSISQKSSLDADFLELALMLTESFSERVQEIIHKRFGLHQEKSETLEKIGRDHGITRERVRQIISDSMKKIHLKRDQHHFREAIRRIIFTIESNSGIIKETKALKVLGKGKFHEENAIRFFVGCSDKVKIVESDVLERSWLSDNGTIEEVSEVSTMVMEVLDTHKKPLSEEQLLELALKNSQGYSKEKIKNYLEVMKSIRKNRFGKWGFGHWKEISPKGTKEKIYLILKEVGRPLHFTEIAQLMDEYQMVKKKAHPQTIHNELIKNEQFVLVGRGIYALKEWGYKEGTVKDVITDILKKSGKPMEKDEILKKVAKVRTVKKATVMINLNNKNWFVRNGDEYSLKK
jgi:DNA-directed RNA polymerase delta subunit